MKKTYYNIYGNTMSLSVKKELQRITHGSDFSNLATDLRDEIYKMKGTQMPLKCKQAILRFLKNRKAPVIWLEPLFEHIRTIWLKNDIFPFPFSNNIKLRIGSKDIVPYKEIILNQDKEGKLIGDDNSMSIIITGKTTGNQIIEFIRNNRKIIEEWQNVINLPSNIQSKSNNIELASRIVEMVNKGISYSEISDILSKDPQLSDNENTISDSQNIKNIYNRYKNYFYPKKK